MDRMAAMTFLTMATALGACGGGGGTGSASLGSETLVESVPDRPVISDDSGTASTIEPLATTIGTTGLSVVSTSSIQGDSVALGIGTNLAIDIGTNGDVQVQFDQRNRTYFPNEPDFPGYAGYANEDESELIIIALPGANDSGLIYTTFGYWAQSDAPDLIDGGVPATEGGAFFGGNITPINQMPTSGTARYAGLAVGHDAPLASGSGRGEGILNGQASFTANFADGSIAGELSMLNAEGIDYTTVTLENARISANTFEGSGNSPLGHSGTVRGRFYGGTAEELGGVAEMQGPSNLQIGFGAAQQ